MSDLALPELKLVDPPASERRLVWTALASLMLHAGLLALVVWSPLRDVVEPEPPQAIEVELVEPPQVEAPEPPPSEEKPPESPTEEKPTEDAPEEVSPAEPAAASQAAPAETPDAAAAPSAAPPPPASAASAEAPGEPPPAAEVPSVPPPAPRPPADTRDVGKASAPSGDPVAALSVEAGDAEGVSPDALSADPGVAALDLGEPREADRFYLEAMLQQPGLARARDMLPTLPRDKRVAQTCNIEAMAQIAYSGEGFAPDVVMADAYAQSVVTDRGLSATGAVFRSEDKWYGLAFDCTLNDDLTQVTAFSYRLGADVTDAVVARLEQR